MIWNTAFRTIVDRRPASAAAVVRRAQKIEIGSRKNIYRTLFNSALIRFSTTTRSPQESWSSSSPFLQPRRSPGFDPQSVPYLRHHLHLGGELRGGGVKGLRLDLDVGTRHPDAKARDPFVCWRTENFPCPDIERCAVPGADHRVS